jgi:hypothetical protein
VGQTCIRHGNKRNAQKIVLGKLEGRIPCGTPRDRWKNIITIYLKNIL